MANNNLKIIEEYDFHIKSADVTFYRDKVTNLDKDIVYNIPLGADYNACSLSFFLEHENNLHLFTISENYRKIFDFDDDLYYKISKEDFTYIHWSNKELPLNIKCYEDGSVKGTIITEELGRVTLFEFDKDGHLDFNGDVFGQLYTRQHIGLDNDITVERKIRTQVEDVHPKLKDIYFDKQQQEFVGNDFFDEMTTYPADQAMIDNFLDNEGTVDAIDIISDIIKEEADIREIDEHGGF